MFFVSKYVVVEQKELDQVYIWSEEQYRCSSSIFAHKKTPFGGSILNKPRKSQPTVTRRCMPERKC